MQKDQLRILTYNIHKGFSAGNRKFILPQLREALIKADADILFLQEIQGENTKHAKIHPSWPDNSHSEFLAQNTWPHVIYAKNAIYNVGHHGNAILSKHALHSWENINVSPYGKASRSLLHGVIQLPNISHDLHIICIHLGVIGIERRYQFKTLFNRIEEHVPHNAPLIVAGDFNDWTGQAEKRFAKQLDLNEAHKTLHDQHAKTWPAWLPILKMDRIYYRGIQPLSCERPTHGLWSNLSDHNPLLATFEI
ncbi:MAG: endonuclease/exonuclease/phosphatase family protein [Methylophaga sp.]|nr:endonuclease/exonuclease/phosphatase family protein [Methylophaga sp.]